MNLDVFVKSAQCSQVISLLEYLHHEKNMRMEWTNFRLSSLFQRPVAIKQAMAFCVIS